LIFRFYCLGNGRLNTLVMMKEQTWADEYLDLPLSFQYF
jgi:hypothetical protein